MFRTIKFEVVYKENGAVVRKPVEALQLDHGTIRAEVLPDPVEGQITENLPNKVVKVDWVNTFLVQATGVMDKVGAMIWHGDLLKDADDKLHEVVFYNAGFFVLMGEGEDMHGVAIEDAVARTLTRVGDVYTTPELVGAKPEQMEKAVEESTERNDITSEEIKE